MVLNFPKDKPIDHLQQGILGHLVFNRLTVQA